jgi:hypothetical protein
MTSDLDLTAVLAILAAIEAIAIGLLCAANYALWRENRAVIELLSDTGAIPLDQAHVAGKPANDSRP